MREIRPIDAKNTSERLKHTKRAAKLWVWSFRVIEAKRWRKHKLNDFGERVSVCGWSHCHVIQLKLPGTRHTLLTTPSWATLHNSWRVWKSIFMLLLVQWNISELLCLLYSIHRTILEVLRVLLPTKWVISKILQSGTMRTNAFGLCIIKLVITITCLDHFFQLIKANNQVWILKHSCCFISIHDWPYFRLITKSCLGNIQ